MIRQQIRLMLARRHAVAALVLCGAASLPAGEVTPAVYTAPAGEAASSEILLAGGFGRFGKARVRKPAAEQTDEAKPRPLSRLFGFRKAKDADEEAGDGAEDEARDAKSEAKLKESTLVLSQDSPMAKPAAKGKTPAVNGKTPSEQSVHDKIAELYAKDGREMPDFDYRPAPVDTPELKKMRQKSGVKHPVLDATPEEREAMAAAERAKRQAAYRAKIAAARAEAAKGFELTELPPDLVELDPENLFPEDARAELAPVATASTPRPGKTAAAPQPPTEEIAARPTPTPAAQTPAAEPKPAAEATAVAEAGGWRKPQRSTGWYARIDAGQERPDAPDATPGTLRPSADPVYTEDLDMVEMALDADAEPATDGGWSSQDPLADVFSEGEEMVGADESLSLTTERPAAAPGDEQPTVAAEVPAAEEPAVQTEPAEPDPRAIVAARPQGGFKGFCPVTLCDHRELTDADERFSVVYRDRTYTFSSEDALRKFRENPGKYAPVLGGLDVVRLHATGHRVDGVLDHAAWYAGRLYLFSSADTLAIFTASPKSYPVAE